MVVNLDADVDTLISTITPVSVQTNTQPVPTSETTIKSTTSIADFMADITDTGSGGVADFI